MDKQTQRIKLTITMPVSLQTALDRQAAVESRSRSNMVSIAVSRYLEEAQRQEDVPKHGRFIESRVVNGGRFA